MYLLDFIFGFVIGKTFPVAVLIGFVGFILFMIGILILGMPFMAYYAFMDWRTRKDAKRFATDPAYRAYKRKQAWREQARRRVIDRRIAARRLATRTPFREAVKKFTAA